jgi:hypothetical protein
MGSEMEERTLYPNIRGHLGAGQLILAGPLEQETCGPTGMVSVAQGSS